MRRTIMLQVAFFVFTSMAYLSNAYGQVSDIFTKDLPIDISWEKCGNDQAFQAVEVNRKTWTINWEWENKRQAWCGWGSESLPENDLSNFLDGYLVIKFEGSYHGKPPEVKFIYSDDTSTDIVNIFFFIERDSSVGTTVKIPMSEFEMDPALSADPKRLKGFQFDAEYNSIRGEIEISYIGLSMEESSNIITPKAKTEFME